MPHPAIIRPVAIIDSPPAPAKRNLDAPSSSTASSTAASSSAVAEQHQLESLTDSIDDADGASLAAVSVMAPTKNQDVIHQWDALYEREKNKVYAIISSDHHDAMMLIPEDQRIKLCTWSYAVVDKYDIPRHTVSIATAYFDRLVSNGWVEMNEYSLASVTCLYLAVKINSTSGRVFEAAHMAHESVYFSASQIIDMEDHICQVFDWYMNPPVPSQFVDIIAPLLLSETMTTTAANANAASMEDDDVIQGIISIQDPIRQDVLRHSHYLCELSVMDSYFSDKEPSSVACASVLTAMDCLRFPSGAKKWWAFLPLSRDMNETEECARRLRQLYYGSCIGGEYGAREEVCSDQPGGTTSSSSQPSSQPRAVTPTKGETPPDLKRMRRDATVETLDM
ncbi:hypothetical protein ACHAXH_009275 [Discostella pseudostelligera]